MIHFEIKEKERVFKVYFDENILIIHPTLKLVRDLRLFLIRIEEMILIPKNYINNWFRIMYLIITWYIVDLRQENKLLL